MKQFEYTVKDPQGIHARPAGLFVKAAAAHACAVTITKGDKTVDAKRIMAVMGLGIKQGETILVKADGDGEDAAAKELEAFLKANL